MRFNLTIAIAALVFLPACGQRARYIDPDSNQGIVQVAEINNQDFLNASKALIKELVHGKESPKPLQNFQGDGKPLVAIAAGPGGFKNNTSTEISPEWFFNSVEAALLNTGIARVDPDKTIRSANATVADYRKFQHELREDEQERRRALQKQRDFFGDEEVPRGARLEEDIKEEKRFPDFVVEGAITYKVDQSGKNRRSTYIFMAQLINVAKGELVWTDTFEVNKLGNKDAVRW